jgi:hypothetical protein
MDTKSLEELVPLFWQRLEYMDAWRMCFERKPQQLFLLKHVLRYVPVERGTLEFMEDHGGKRFLLLLTSDLNNVGTWENQAWILSVLTETAAISGVAVEGAFDPFDFTRFRAFPDLSITREIALAFLRKRDLAAHSFVGITAAHPVDTFGIDDLPLYQKVLPLELERGPAYWDLIRQRMGVMLENTLRIMDQKQLSLVAVCFMDYNFEGFHRLLHDRRVSHAGIRPAAFGKNLDDLWKQVFATEPDTIENLLRIKPQQ